MAHGGAALAAEAGYTLAELLVVVALSGVLLGGVLTVLVAGQGSHGYGAARVEAQQAARAGLERLVKELREAGYDPRGAGIAAVVVAEPSRVAFQRDLDGDGAVAPTRERVTYLLRDGVLRRDAGGGAQPVVERVTGFRLTYFDREGAATADAGRVGAVAIRLEVGGRGATVVVESRVTLRNRPL